MSLFSTLRKNHQMIHPLSICIFTCLFSFVCFLPRQMSATEHASDIRNPRDCVVVLHGLARTSSSMEKMNSFLENAGYATANIDYPSRDFPIETLAEKIIPEAIKSCTDQTGGKVHFVTHSLGGILVRYYFKENKIDNIGRVVMLSPPNHGSEIVDNLAGWPGFKFINGPAGMQLGTGQQSLLLQLGAPEFKLGIITGNFSFNPFYSYLIAGEDDGKVSIESAKLEGMKDFLVVPHSHSFIMNSDVVIEKTLNFFKKGKF